MEKSRFTENEHRELEGQTDICDKRSRMMNMVYCNVVEQCKELAFLELTLKRQDLGGCEKFKAIVVNMLNNPNFKI